MSSRFQHSPPMQLGEMGVAYDSEDGTSYTYSFTLTRVRNEWVREIRIDVSALDMILRPDVFNLKADFTYKAQAEDYTVKTTDRHLAIVADSIRA
jgi:hypothetical protein